MPTVHFTSHLRKFAACDSISVTASTVGEALTKAFADNGPLRSYVLDEQGQLRRHMTVFVDGELIVDRIAMSDPVDDASELYVMQALSGG